MPSHRAEFNCGENDVDLYTDWVLDRDCGEPTYTGNYCLIGNDLSEM